MSALQPQGGWTPQPQAITSDVLQVCEAVKGTVLFKAAAETESSLIDRYIPLSFTSQVVSGVNYKVTIQISATVCVTATIWYRAWMGQAQVTSVSGPLVCPSTAAPAPAPSATASPYWYYD
jgi:hypothetical protein